MLCYDFNIFRHKLQEKFSYRYTKNCTSNFYLQKIPMQVNIQTAFYLEIIKPNDFFIGRQFCGTFFYHRTDYIEFSELFKVGRKKPEHHSKIYQRYNGISKISEK